MIVRLRFLYALLAALFIAWTSGFFMFVGAVPKEETVDYGSTDGVAVLTGGKRRVLEGMILMEQQISDRMLISGVGGNATLDALLMSLGVAPKDAAGYSSRIEIDYDSHSTAQNAEAIAEWAKKHRLRHIRLVTSNYHMPRAMYELRRQMPLFPVVAHPVFTPAFRADHWWRHPNSIGILLAEYTKFIAAIAVHGLSDRL